MTDSKTSILLSDVSIEGDLVEKDKIIIDAKVNGDIKADEIDTHNNSNILGNIKSNKASLGGKIKGNVHADKINIKKTAVRNNSRYISTINVKFSQGNLFRTNHN